MGSVEKPWGSFGGLGTHWGGLGAHLGGLRGVIWAHFGSLGAHFWSLGSHFSDLGAKISIFTKTPEFLMFFNGFEGLRVHFSSLRGNF